MIINLILINFIIIYVWDILNFPNTIAGLLTALLTKGRIKNVELKAPLGCAFSSKITLYSITLIDSIIDKLFRWLDGVINK